jgi:drug/metabolite transporter (DMT)-like permease
VLVTVVAFFLWLQGVSKVPTGTVAVFTSVLPIRAVLLSWVLLGEPVRLAHLVWIFFISRAPEPT